MITAIMLLNILSPNNAYSSGIPAPVTEVFAPLGFDENDQSEVVVEGYLPTPCYEPVQIRKQLKGKTLVLSVTTQKKGSNFTQAQGFCPDVIVPYAKTVQFGKLKPARYQVVANPMNESEPQKALLAVAESKSTNIDQYPYAISKQVNRDERTKQFFLEGMIYADCYEIGEIKTLSNKKNVISVMPILKQIKNQCNRDMIPFKVKLALPLDTLKSDRFMIHVRSADGQAVNSIHDR